ncbi:MAG: hypothetical protein KDJ67_07935 [Nitratireductor sp.]|nr:hypothetical protein [Nitratireductor sp.]
MEQVEQLKAMRDAAKARIEALPDYRLMSSLTTLINELEEAFGLAPVAENAGEETSEEASASDADDGLAAIPEELTDEPAIEEPEEPAMEETVDVAPQEPEPDASDAGDEEIAGIDFSTLEAEITGDGAETTEPETTASAQQENSAEDDEDEAIRRAMQELEADLESVKL